MKKQLLRGAIAALAILPVAACQTLWGGIPDETPGPKPTDLRRLVMETIEPDSIFRRRWSSEIGPINDQTEMVMSELVPGTLVMQGGWTRRDFAGWKFCATLVNPPAEGAREPRVGVVGVWVRGEGMGSPTGMDRCLWLKPSEGYLAQIEAAKERQRNKPTAN